MRAAYFTFGCKLNFAETSAIGRALADNGIQRVNPGEIPDICVVNTCSVTEAADKKCRQLIHSLARKYPQAIIVATGCYAQLKPDVVAKMPGVSIVLGANDKLRIVQFINQWLSSHAPQKSVTPFMEMKEFVPSCEKGDRTRWFLKVQDGCDCFCSYCTIPYARGRSRSGTIPDMIAQAQYAAAHGAREIILTGVNIGDFGKGRADTFFDLIRALEHVEGIDRYRISSIEPDLLTDDIIQWVANESRKFMPHFHIPLQSGSDTVLNIMGRHYDTSLFRHKIELIHSLMPHAFIGVDVIAGSRGEGDKEWLESKTFIQSLPITRLHIFPYSERPGTRILKTSTPGVDMHTRRLRVAQLTEISNTKLQHFLNQHTAQTRPVLWETCHDGIIKGFTDNYIRVEAEGSPSLCNTITDTLLLTPRTDTMKGEILS